MTDQVIGLRPADDEGALAFVETLLDRADLPTEDLRSGPARFYVAKLGHDRVGAVGLERHGTDGLLRSLVVAASHRGTGIGTATCQAIEEVARGEGVERLFLLTTTAADFFAVRGYDETDRESVPPAIEETTQFSELCPDSATCMQKRL